MHIISYGRYYMILRLVHKFLKKDSGAVAIEFAIVSLPFFYVLFASFEVSYKAIVQSELDEKIFLMANDIALNDHIIESGSEYITDEFCSNNSTTFLKCSDIELGVRLLLPNERVYDLVDVSVINDWNIGEESSPLLLEVNYPLTNLLHPIAVADIIERGDEKFYRSRAIIRREPLLTVVRRSNSGTTTITTDDDDDT